MKIITETGKQDGQPEVFYYLQGDRKKILINPIMEFLHRFGNCEDEMNLLMQMIIDTTLLKGDQNDNVDPITIDGNTRYSVLVLRDLRDALSKCQVRTV